MSDLPAERPRPSAPASRFPLAAPPQTEALAARVAEAFELEFGGPASGVWAAPGRVNLIGEHTDYNAGLVLPIALAHTTGAAARLIAEPVVRCRSLDVRGGAVEVPLAEVGPGTPGGWAAYVAGTIWALRKGGLVPADTGFEVVLASEVPIGAGLSSSAAIECAVAAAVCELAGSPELLASSEGRRRLARAAQEAENLVVGAPTGGMDQLASMLGREGRALMIDFESDGVSSVPFHLADHGLVLLVVDTRAHHALVDGQYGSRREECEEAARLLGLGSLRGASLADLAGLPDVLKRRTRHQVTENARVVGAGAALAADDFVRLGRLFNESHASLRDDFEVTVPELDVACEEALAGGALGARMTGGGFGGSIIALVEENRAPAVAAGVVERFGREGFRLPRAFLAAAAEGARRVR